MAPLVKVFVIIFALLAYPLGSFLDWLLGQHRTTRFPKKDLKALMELHETPAGESSHVQNSGSGLTKEEINMVNSTIDLREKKVSQIMISIEKCFMISNRERITEDLLDKILAKGYSRIVIFEEKDRNKILGTVKAKELLEMNDDKYHLQAIGDVAVVHTPLIVTCDTNLLEMLIIFQQKKQTIAMIANEEQEIVEEDLLHEEAGVFGKIINNTFVSNTKIIGLVALKDIFEELLAREFMDDDRHLNLGSLQVEKERNFNLDVNYRSNYDHVAVGRKRQEATEANEPIEK